MQGINEAIQPLNITAATLLIQLLLLGSLALTVFILRSGQKRSPRFPEEASLKIIQLPTLILGIALFSFAILLASEDLYAVWRPLFSGLEISTIEARTSLSIVFILDIVLIGILMFLTGGSKDSPFTPVLFMLPALAIFLRESPGRFIFYAIVAGLVFIVLLLPRLSRYSQETNPFHKQAFAFMAIACLALSMFTGYITRPIPIDQLTTKMQMTIPSP